MITAQTYFKHKNIIPSEVWIVIIAVLYVTRDIVRIGVPDILFTGMIGLSFLMLPLEDGISVFMFSSVLTLPGNEIRLLYILSYFLKRDRKLVFPSAETITLLGMLSLQLIDMVAYSKGGIGSIIYSYITFSFYLVIPLLWVSIDIPKEKLVNAVKAYLLGIIFVGLITIYMTISLYGVGVLMSGNNSLGRLLGDYSTGGMVTNNNRNSLGSNLAIALAFLLVLLEKRGIKRLFGLIGILLCIVMIVLTRSRSAFVCLGIIICFWTIISATKRGKRGSAITLLVFLVIMIFMIRAYLPDIWNGAVSRFINQEDISNGRLMINSQYISIWESDLKCLLFGYGAQSYADVTNVINSPHNIIVDILISWGIFGLSILVAFMIIFAKRSYNNISKENIKYWILLIAVNMFGLMLDQYLTVPIKHIQLMFIFLSAGILKNDYAIE